MDSSTTSETVLIFDAHESLRKEISEVLRNHSFVILASSDIDEGLRYFREAKPNVVFLDLALPEDSAESVLEVISKEAPDSAVVLVPASDEIPESIGKYSIDAYDVLTRPVQPAMLNHLIRHNRFHTRLMEGAVSHVRYLERRTVSLEVKISELEKHGAKLIRENRDLAQSDRQVRKAIMEREDTKKQLRIVQTAIDKATDAILIIKANGIAVYFNDSFSTHFGVPPKTGLARLFKNRELASIMKQQVRELGEFTVEAAMMTRAGSEFPALVSANAIRDEVTGDEGIFYIFSDMTEQEKLRKEAYHDSLTDLYSRGHFLELLQSNTSLARRHTHPLSLCICDLDKFKIVNDTYGHMAGDIVLSTFSRIVADEIRSEDVAGRIGGDEFCIFFPHVPADVASICLERIRSRFDNEVFKNEAGDTFNATASFGISDLPLTGVSMEQFLELADQSLYRAKEQGHNCTVANMERIELPHV
jgi:diguanylate cyclase (GGDEF)-like protein/PAS domain S-box-containing protein